MPPKIEDKEAKKPTRFFGLSRNVIGMGVVSFLNDLSSDMIFPFIPIFLTTTLGASASFAGPVGTFSDKIGHRNAFMIGMVLTSIIYFLFGKSSNVTSVWFLFILFGLATAFIEAVGRGDRL